MKPLQQTDFIPKNASIRFTQVSRRNAWFESLAFFLPWVFWFWAGSDYSIRKAAPEAYEGQVDSGPGFAIYVTLFLLT